MSENRKYYLVPEDSPVMAKIRRAQEQLKAFTAAALELQKECGAERLWMSDGIVCGLSFTGAPPDGWYRKAGVKYFSPNLRTKRGQALRGRLLSIPKDPRHPLELSRIVGFSHYDRSAGQAYFPGVFNFDGQIVISMHVDTPEKPEGCQRLTTDEYVALKEAAEKSEEAA